MYSVDQLQLQFPPKRQSRWRPTGRQILWTVGAIVAIVGTFIFLRLAYFHEWRWTGLVTFPGYDKKTLWDWLDLLIVPVVLAIGGYLFTLSDSRRTREQADHRREEEVLQAYLNQMWQLLLDKDLRSTSKANNNSEALTAAWASTLTTLERIHHSDKKGIIVKFLWMWQRSLLEKQDTVVILEGANLKEADLSGADLRKADLRKADLRKALLRGADLSGANLPGANLRKSDLRGAEVTKKQLAACKSLKEAIMPNGQKYEEWLKNLLTAS
jgi:hypothetical protein